jgi:glycosyltransferase involved in cell wall biosynthesis
MEKDETNLERLKFGGLCYLEGDIEDLGRKILMLLQDNNLREKLANEGRDYMKERYNYKKKLLDIQSVLLQEYQHFSPRK